MTQIVRRVIESTALAGFLCLTGTQVLAQSVCVTCVRPPASYKCVLKLPEGIRQPSGGSRLFQLACLEDIAKRYGHEVCKVRSGMVGPCIGDEHIITLGGRTAPPPRGAGTQSSERQPVTPPAGAQTPRPPATTASTPPDKPSEAAEQAPPKTVVEMTKRAGKDTKRQLEQAGDAVGGAMKKSWRCVTSLFKDC